MIPPKPLSSKVWVSGRGLARDWQAWESGRSQPVVKKQRARYDIECGDFGLAGGTVGWARTTDLLFHSRTGMAGDSQADDSSEPKIQGPNRVRK
jgi:hypothetical protein